MAVKENNRRGRFVWLCIGVFVASFLCGILIKATYKSPAMKKYEVKWKDSMGTIVKDIPYGEGEANKFDLYLPADKSRDSYNLVVYLHPGGFTSGDKSGDASMLQWLCSKGYVAAGINYTLFGEANPGKNVYTQSMEIKESMPFVVEKARELGYNITAMGIAGGSAGGALALIYAYRDAADSPVPVKMVFQAVGPSCFYPEDWTCFGFDKNPEAGLGLFSVMAGTVLTPDMLGTPAYDEAIKPISAALWVDEHSVPTLCAYGALDKMQAYPASLRLKAALEKYNVKHEFYVGEHSGHGIQNDTPVFAKYMEAVVRYLDTYLPVK